MTSAWIIFVVYSSFIAIMAFLRVLSLTMHSGWRSELGDAFPEDCGSWAKDDGCTRIEAHADRCVRPEIIPDQFEIVFYR
mmetsp:Transcript_34746/g.45714  ORF Transcript_34746/g.45714 Transcript_34746/m.45714 type:complete len:80 (+) Transcript_34746:339-578(+)